MAYEYEERNRGVILAGTLFDDGDIEKQPAFEELKEVYRKAKAFNKIANLIESNYVEYGENNLEDVEAIVNEYWEDTKNE